MTEYVDDPEIRDLLQQAQGREASIQKAAWGELQRYRTEALAAVKIGEDTIEGELRVALARGKLKERLRKLQKT